MAAAHDNMKRKEKSKRIRFWGKKWDEKFFLRGSTEAVLNNIWVLFVHICVCVYKYIYIKVHRLSFTCYYVHIYTYISWCWL